MLSLKLIRENPSILETSLQNRQQDTTPVETLMMLDKRWRVLKQEGDKLKAEKNAESMKIADAKKKGGNADAILAKTKELTHRITLVDEDASSLETQMEQILLAVPNIPDKSVPIGKSEADNPEIRKWGTDLSGIL